MDLILKALSDPTRREILRLLREKDLSAGEIGACFPVTGATMSHHFSVLKEAGLVESEKRGAVVLYSIQTTVLQELMGFLYDALKVERNENES